MNHTSITYEWLSAHLFYTGNAEHVLTNIVNPFVKQVNPVLHPASPWFFIRYAEDGLHIRLRLHVNRQALVSIKTALEADLIGTGVVLKYIPYEPEVKRYGNHVTMPLAEALFHASANCSLEYLAVQPEWDVQTALTVACKMNLAFLYALNSALPVITKICRRFVDAWLTRLVTDHAAAEQLKGHMLMLYNKQANHLQEMAVKLWTQLQNGQAPALLQTYSNTCQPLLNAYRQAGLLPEQLGYAIRSFLHMNHNRLGVSNKEEAWCMFIIEKCLQYLYEQAT
jgi:thiopeptide-type bacteriocin biosynthesis protein